MYCGERTFRITHPFHPLHGREFELVAHYHGWGEERVAYRNQEGVPAFVPLSWTSLGVPEPLVAVGSGRSAFRADDLAELASIVQRLLAERGEP